MHIGTVTTFHEKISVAAVTLNHDLKLGDIVSVDGKALKVFSLEINGMPVEGAKAGDSVGIKTKFPVKEGDHLLR